MSGPNLFMLPSLNQNKTGLTLFWSANVDFCFLCYFIHLNDSLCNVDDVWRMSFHPRPKRVTSLLCRCMGVTPRNLGCTQKRRPHDSERAGRGGQSASADGPWTCWSTTRDAAPSAAVSTREWIQSMWSTGSRRNNLEFQRELSSFYLRLLFFPPFMF